MIKSLKTNTVKSRFKKGLDLQIHLHKAVLRFNTEIFLKSNNSRFKKGKVDFLKSRVYCNQRFEFTFWLLIQKKKTLLVYMRKLWTTKN